MNAPGRAMVTGFAAAIVALALAGPALTQSRATMQSGAQPSAVDSPAAKPAEPAPWLQNLTSWLQAISEHKPGEMDVPATLMGSATEADLEAVRVDFFALLDLHKRAIERGARSSRIIYKDVPLTPPGIQELLGLTSQEAERSDATRILRRGAILHADVAMLVIPRLPRQVGCSSPSVILVRDGQQVGHRCSGLHWAQGRALLDAIRPDPRKDPTVRLWYQATIAYMLEDGDYASGVPQMDHGSLFFPDDPQLLFEHGYYHEAFASPYVQPAAQANMYDIRRAAQATRIDVRPAFAHLKEAEELFRRALERDPNLLEARMHRGVVLGALGRHDEAAVELRKVVAAAQGRVFRYYAELFLGDEEQALGSRDEARTHYNEAAALYPLAQSPHIALSHLARRGGDRTWALAAMRQVLNLPADERGREDPWWTYYVWLNKNSRMLLDELYRPFVSGGRQ